MLVQTAEYGTSQTPHYDSGPEPGANHPVTKSLVTSCSPSPVSREREEMGLSCVKDWGYLWRSFLMLKVAQH